MSPAQLAPPEICQQPGLTPSFPKSGPATPRGPDEALRPHTPRLEHPAAEGSSSAPQTCTYGDVSLQKGAGVGVENGVYTGAIRLHPVCFPGTLDFLSLSQYQVTKWMLTTGASL